MVLYDNQTSAMFQTDQQFPSIGSQKKGIEINPDTSVDVYFGPKSAAGKENNWVQTIPGKVWNVILRPLRFPRTTVRQVAAARRD